MIEKGAIQRKDTFRPVFIEQTSSTFGEQCIVSVPPGGYSITMHKNPMEEVAFLLPTAILVHEALGRAIEAAQQAGPKFPTETTPPEPGNG